MNLIKEDIELYSYRFIGLSEALHDQDHDSNFLSAHQKFDNAKAIIKNKIKNSDKAAHPFLKKQIKMIELKQNKLNNQYNTINQKKQAVLNQIQAHANAQIQQQAAQQQANEIAAQQQPQEQQNPNAQPIMQQQAPNQPQQPQAPVYDPMNPEHASIIQQYHQHKMAHVRAHKEQKNNVTETFASAVGYAEKMQALKDKAMQHAQNKDKFLTDHKYKNQNIFKRTFNKIANPVTYHQNKVRKSINRYNQRLINSPLEF